MNNMAQSTLFDNPLLEDICRHMHRGNQQSAQANRNVEPRKRSLREKILEWWDHEATCDEAERALGLSHQTVSARVSELRRSGHLVPTGKTRATTGGSQAAILRARVG